MKTWDSWVIQEETTSHYLDEVLEQDDAFSDVGRIAGPDQAPGILKLRSRTHLTWAGYLRNGKERHQLPFSTFDIEPQCTTAKLYIEHLGLGCHLPLLQLCVILLLKPLEVLGAHGLLQHRFHFNLSCPRLRRQKILRSTISVSEREPLRLARSTQNSLKSFWLSS